MSGAIDADYIYSYITNRKGISLEKLNREVFDLLATYKKYKTHIITELSIIRDREGFKNENEILNSIEQFSWGIEASDYVRHVRPSQIPVYDYSILTRGIDTPPHIEVIANLAALGTKSAAARTFEELVRRILRQLLLKVEETKGGENSDYIGKVIDDIFDNFHAFSNQLKNRHSARSTIEIADEYDVQDLLHAILRIHFKDVRAEEYTPSFAGSSARMDFLLTNENIVIEVKKTRPNLTDREIGSQLILDIAHYRNHQNCKELKCFVYDPENKIKNPRGLENDINKQSNEKMTVKLYIRP